MIRRPAAIALIAAFGLGASLGAGFAALAQDSTDFGSNAGDYHASGAGTDGNVVVSGNRRAPETAAPPPNANADTGSGSGGIVPTATAAAGGSGGATGGGVVIPPNPALTGDTQPGAVPVSIVEETTSGESVLGPTPTPAPTAREEEAVTADDSASSGDGQGDGGGDAAAADDSRRNGDASASAVDGSTTGGGGATSGSVNEVIPATTGIAPSSNPSSQGGDQASAGSGSGSGRGARGACGYPTWLDAQTALETRWSVELADELDPDRDGIACEEAMR